MNFENFEEFVRVWQTAHSPKEVATKFGMHGRTAGTIAAALRRLGVDLKVFPKSAASGVRSLQPGEIAQLKELARKAALSTAVKPAANGARR